MVICGMAQNNVLPDVWSYTAQGSVGGTFRSMSLVHPQLLGAHPGQDIHSDSAQGQDAEADDKRHTSMHTDVHAIMDINTFLSKYCHNACSNHCNPYEHIRGSSHREF